jgi:hypothetical protein
MVKVLRLLAVPRVGEWIKFRNAVLGDYFAWRVSEVTYRESGQVEVDTELLDDVGGRGYSFDQEAEFDECYGSYVREGWTSPGGIKPNTRYRGPAIT